MIQSPYATILTRKGVSSPADLSAKDQAAFYYNGKPYRTPFQKHAAKKLARKDSDGVFRSTAPVSCHPFSN